MLWIVLFLFLSTTPVSDDDQQVFCIEIYCLYSTLVKELINTEHIDVNIVNGQFDLSTSTPGTVSWVEKLVKSDWKIINGPGTNPRRGVINIRDFLAGYFKKHKRLTQYTVLRTGHGLITENRETMGWILKKIIGAAP